MFQVAVWFELLFVRIIHYLCPDWDPALWHNSATFGSRKHALYVFFADFLGSVAEFSHKLLSLFLSGSGSLLQSDTWYLIRNMIFINFTTWFETGYVFISEPDPDCYHQIYSLGVFLYLLICLHQGCETSTCKNFFSQLKQSISSS